MYYRDAGRTERRKVASARDDAERGAAQVNAQLARSEPTLLAFTPVPVADLRRQFLDYHEHVLRSSLATVRRYRAATQHLETFALAQPRPPLAHEVRPEAFAAYLRTVQVAPNGHAHSAKRTLRTKGVRYVLETCRSLYQYALTRRHLPPYAGNPFAALPLDRLNGDDAKPVFVFTAHTELAVLRAASPWAFGFHFALAKTGLRVGELTHLLIEDVDLDGGWLHVRNKAELGWRVKTGQERVVPLLPEVTAVLRQVIGGRADGPVFRRERIAKRAMVLTGNRAALGRDLAARRAAAGKQLTRAEEASLAHAVWWDAGAVKADAVRTSFCRLITAVGRPDTTCPKSWRHTFATLLQDANVDPLIRQQVMGHRPTAGTGLGMTARYTHTRPETLRAQVEAALRLWPDSLAEAI